MYDTYLKRGEVVKKFLKKHKKLLGNLKTYGIITFGTLSSAIGISLFLSHSNVVAGGVSGVGIILHGLYGFPIGLFMLITNIPILLIGFKMLGRSFLLKTIYGTIMFSVFTDLTSYIRAFSQDILLSALVGGALIGIGMGCVFLVGATTGGVDVLAKILNKFFPVIDVGKCLFFIDFIIILASGIVFANYELCLYGIISLLVVTYLIDNIIQGANSAKMVYIISDSYEKIADKIMCDIDRGLTSIDITGMYKNKSRKMLMCVLKKHELVKLRNIITKIDEKAFIIFIGAREVSGEGFKIYPIN